MKICRKNALKLWEMCYGSALYAEDFHGNLMCRDGYGNPDFYIYENGERIYCGWNLHHILRGHSAAVMQSAICSAQTLRLMTRQGTGLHFGLTTVCIRCVKQKISVTGL